MSEIAFSISHLAKRFPARVEQAAAQVVIDDLDMTVRSHEFICILGPSGCGKSTLLNILAGLDTDYDGEIHVGGQTVRHGRLPVRLGYLFQEPRLLPWLNAEANVDFALHSCGIARNRWAELKDRHFSMARLQEFRRHHPHQMSGGMMQRLALVRALCVEPDILLMDEPFSGLDELTARRLREDLLEIWRETRKTIVFVTHNAYEATFLADRILVMSQGRVREEIAIDVERPRDYDDPAIFDINRRVVRIFLEVAEKAAAAAPHRL